MSKQAQRNRYEHSQYNAGYELGKEAWEASHENAQDTEPDYKLKEGMSAMKRDGFDAGWNDAMVEGL